MNADGIIGANKDHIGYNLYAYVSNNFVNSFDPSGKNIANIATGIFNKVVDMAKVCAPPPKVCAPPPKVSNKKNNFIGTNYKTVSGNKSQTITNNINYLGNVFLEEKTEISLSNSKNLDFYYTNRNEFGFDFNLPTYSYNFNFGPKEISATNSYGINKRISTTSGISIENFSIFGSYNYTESYNNINETLGIRMDVNIGVFYAIVAFPVLVPFMVKFS